jgi:hypothetical protein
LNLQDTRHKGFGKKDFEVGTLTAAKTRTTARSPTSARKKNSKCSDASRERCQHHQTRAVVDTPVAAACQQQVLCWRPYTDASKEQQQAMSNSKDAEATQQHLHLQEHLQQRGGKQQFTMTQLRF